MKLSIKSNSSDGSGTMSPIISSRRSTFVIHSTGMLTTVFDDSSV